MKHIKALLFLAPLALFSCNISTDIYTTNIQDIATFEEESFIYSLPMTCLAVQCTAVRTIYIPGPYASSAEEKLNIKGVGTTADISWEISNISITPYTEPDPEQFYSVRNKNATILQQTIVEMTNKGLMLNKGDYELANSYLVCNNESVSKNINQFSFYQPAIDIEQLTAESFNTVPYLKKHLKLEDAKLVDGAAKGVTRNRALLKRMFTTDNELYPDGLAVAEGAKILKETEAEFLSLFIGKTFTDTVTQQFFVCPDSKLSIQRHTLFKFSDENGFLDSRSAAGKAVVLEITDIGNTKYLEHLMLPANETAKKNMLLYRIPDKAELRVLNGSLPIANMQVPVFQLGAIVPYYVGKE